MHPLHEKGKFMVPRRDDAPDVGIIERKYTESIQDEIAELASGHCRNFVASTTNLGALVAFGRAIVEMVEGRAAADIEDFERPVKVEKIGIDPEEKRRLVAAELGRLLDWVCKGRSVSDMGTRIFAVASHVRASAIDHRTDQEAAREIGNGSRASINKIKSEFRRELGADYPGENGKGSNTKTRCKNSRLRQLKNSN